MIHHQYSRGISALLALALLVPSAVSAQEDGVLPSENTQPTTETVTPVVPEPTGDIRPPRIEMKRGDDAPKPAEGWSFGESNPQSAPPKGMGTGRIAPTTTRPIDDRMLRRASGTPAIPERTKEMIERREGAREGVGTGTAPMGGKIRERADEAKTRLAEARAEQMKDYVRKTIARMRAAIDRLSKLAERMESRITKMEANQAARANASTTSPTGGVGKVNVQDLSFMKNRLADARKDIEEAKAALAEAESQFVNYVPPASPAESATGTISRPQPGMGRPSPMREPLERAAEAIKSAHKELVSAVQSMKNPGGADQGGN